MCKSADTNSGICLESCSRQTSRDLCCHTTGSLHRTLILGYRYLITIISNFICKLKPDTQYIYIQVLKSGKQTNKKYIGAHCRAWAQPSKHSICAWQKWTPVGAQHAGGGKSKPRGWLSHYNVQRTVYDGFLDKDICCERSFTKIRFYLPLFTAFNRSIIIVSPFLSALSRSRPDFRRLFRSARSVDSAPTRRASQSLNDDCSNFCLASSVRLNFLTNLRSTWTS